jgi:hypothetical protein
MSDALLRSAQHDDQTELEIAMEAGIALPDHDELVLDFEGHRSDGWSVECLHCGAVWWVEDAEPGQSFAFDFDFIEDGDGRCRSHDAPEAT